MYKIVFHPAVIKDDLPKFNKLEQEKILSTIYKKLTVAPQSFGRPLIGKLKGFYKLRISDFRVVYELKKNEVMVLIFKIGQRKDSIVYEEAIKRLKKL